MSLALLMPADATLTDPGSLGDPRVYGPGTVLARGGYLATPTDCTALGLESAPSPANACRVPAGMQYLVFQNISDLPQGATASHALKVRPDAAVFDVGAPGLDFRFTAFTSAEERFLPTFPGSTGVAAAAEHTSDPGVFLEQVEVGAVRIGKREPSPESELLRGVHDHPTTYTLRIHHTGEGDASDVRVVDYLPAGLEDWNAALPASIRDACGWDESTVGTTGADASASLEGAILRGILFDPDTGSFDIGLALGVADPLGPSVEHEVKHSARQSAVYVEGSGGIGATSSGDAVTNDVDPVMTTTSIPALDGVTSASGTEAFGVETARFRRRAAGRAEQDVQEGARARRRGFSPATIRLDEASGGPAAAVWVDEAADHFTAGDEVWYRIQITPPSGSNVPNPRLTDFLPPGLEFDNSAGDSIAVAPGAVTGLGTCVFDPADEAGWVAEFIGDPLVRRPTDVHADFADRAIVVWDLAGVTVPADPDGDPDKRTLTRDGLTLECTVTIPGEGAEHPPGHVREGEPRAALANQEYVNTAQIVSYGVAVNAFDPTPVAHRPVGGPVSTTPAGADEVALEAEGTWDPSNVWVDTASMTKTRVSTEVAPSGTTVTDPANAAGDVVQGEMVTYDVSVSVPAFSSVREGVLQDAGALTRGASSYPYTLDEAVLWTAPGVVAGVGIPPIGFDLEPTTGALSFPDLYTNNTGSDQTFTVRLTVWISRDDIPRGATLGNTATFTSVDAAGVPQVLDDDATVRHVEPQPAIEKSADPAADVQVGQPVTFEIEVSNGDGRPISYDNVVTEWCRQASSSTRTRSRWTASRSTRTTSPSTSGSPPAPAVRSPGPTSRGRSRTASRWTSR